MKIFLDTSSLFKLYHKEDETALLEQVFSTKNITHIFLSEISKAEFTSALWKKVRTKEIGEPEAKTTLKLFESDFEKYTFIATDSSVIEQARILISKYGLRGLRTLDSIQLSTCITLSQHVNLFFTADNLLKSFLEAEGLPTQIPES